jgi:hypothetical protein
MVMKIFSVFSVTVGLAGTAMLQPVMLQDMVHSPAQAEQSSDQDQNVDREGVAENPPMVTVPASPAADAGTDIVMTGGGSGEGSQPYNFQLENEVEE